LIDISNLKNLKVILFHRSVGPENDDRIIKISSSLIKHGCFFHAYLWDRSNLKRKGLFPCGSRWTTFRIPFGSKKIPRPGMLYTIYEIFYETLQAFFTIKKTRPDVIIIQNHRLFLLVQVVLFFHKDSRLIWDLRELPKGFYNTGYIPRIYFSYLANSVGSLIVANESRKNFLVSNFKLSNSLKLATLPNYPLRDWSINTDNSVFNKDNRLLNSDSFVYIQSASSSSRFPYNSVKAALIASTLNIVITGFFEDSVIRKLRCEFGAEFDRRVIFLGYVSSFAISALLGKAYVSLIFYRSDEPNNEYCEPNRLYQALNKGVPVIVGSNLGLRTPIEVFRNGVVLSSDGRSLDSIILAFNELHINYMKYKSNSVLAMGNCIWEDIELSLIKFI